MIDVAMNSPEPTHTLSPGQQPSALQVHPTTKRLARLALWAWLALGLLLWASTLLGPGGGASPLAMARRLGALVAPGLLFVILPLLVWPLAAGLARGAWQLGVDIALRIGAISQLAFALIWSGVAALALVDGADPFERVPWIFPPYLEDFARRHPQIEVLPLNGVRTVHLRAAGGLLVDADGNDLVDAEVSLTPCTTPPTLEQLGGLTMPDDLRCQARLAIRRPAGQRVVWQYRMPRAAGLDELRRHFEAWSKTEQAELRVSGYKDYRVEAHNATRRWDLLIQIGRSDTRVVVPEGGQTLPWPRPVDAAEGDETPDKPVPPR